MKISHLLLVSLVIFLFGSCSTTQRTSSIEADDTYFSDSDFQKVEEQQAQAAANSTPNYDNYVARDEDDVEEYFDDDYYNPNYQQQSSNNYYYNDYYPSYGFGAPPYWGGYGYNNFYRPGLSISYNWGGGGYYGAGWGMGYNNFWGSPYYAYNPYFYNPFYYDPFFYPGYYGGYYNPYCPSFYGGATYGSGIVTSRQKTNSPRPRGLSSGYTTSSGSPRPAGTVGTTKSVRPSGTGNIDGYPSAVIPDGNTNTGRNLNTTPEKPVRNDDFRTLEGFGDRSGGTTTVQTPATRPTVSNTSTDGQGYIPRDPNPMNENIRTGNTNETPTRGGNYSPNPGNTGGDRRPIYVAPSNNDRGGNSIDNQRPATRPATVPASKPSPPATATPPRTSNVGGNRQGGSERTYTAPANRGSSTPAASPSNNSNRGSSTGTTPRKR